MTSDRRTFLGGALLAGLAAAPAARALPVLSADNYGMTYAKAIRGNGWLEIDVERYAANIAELRKVIGATRLCAVVKADAYGHGLDLLVPTLIQSGVTTLGFTANEEARIARTLGFRGQLVRLRTATEDEIEDGFVWDIEEMVGNPDNAAVLDAASARAGRVTRVHFALNSTGMSRNGLELSTDAGKAAAKRIAALSHLRIVGLMSHLPVEEEADSRASLVRFLADRDWVFAETGLARAGVTVHLANSFGTLNVPEARLDMVRCGATLLDDLYGPQFRQVMALKSRVAAINPYPRGNTVCYDRTYRLDRDSWLANIPLGYSDGYRRVFSHANVGRGVVPGAPQSWALIRGRRLPVVGRVTMNTLMVDATDIRDQIRPGDEVVFLGEQGQERIGWGDFEKLSGTIAEDIGTVLGDALPKVIKPRV